MPATALRCRVCETEVALEAVGVCPKCFAPLEPVYDRDELARTATRERIAAGPSSLWRYAPLLPVAPPAEPRLAPGLTPLVRAPRLAETVGVGELWLKLDTANPTHSFKDRVVAVACAKAQELGLTTIACSSTGNLANAVAARAAAEGLEAAVFCPADLEPEKLVATAVYGATVYAVNGTYDDCSRLTVELSFELPWAFVNVGLRTYYAEGSKTLAYEIAEQLGWRTPSAVVAPIASGALFARLHRGFADFLDLGLVDGNPATAHRRSGRRVLAGSSRVRGRAKRHPGPAAHDARARWRSGAPPTATSRSPPRASPEAPSTLSPRTRSARTWRSWPSAPASSARRRPA